MKKLLLIFFVFQLFSPTHQLIADNLPKDKVVINGFLKGWYLADSTESKFKLEAAELKITGDLSPKISYRLDFALHRSLLKDAQLIIKVRPNTRITAGKFIPPFGLDSFTYPSELTAIKYSRISSGVLIIRDIGIRIDGAIKTIRYWLAIMNGVEAASNNGDDDNKDKDMVGRLLWSLSADTKIGTSFQVGKQPPGVRTKLGSDIQARFQNFYIAGEYIYLEDKSLIQNGWYGLMTWRFHPQFEALIRYEDIRRKGDCAIKYDNVFTSGLNWFMETNTKLSFNYIGGRKQSKVNNDELIVQLQMAF